MWPQYTILALSFVGIGMNLAKDGEPRGDYSFWAYSIACIFEMWVLYEGGFFKGML